MALHNVRDPDNFAHIHRVYEPGWNPFLFVSAPRTRKLYRLAVPWLRQHPRNWRSWNDCGAIGSQSLTCGHRLGGCVRSCQDRAHCAGPLSLLQPVVAIYSC